MTAAGSLQRPAQRLLAIGRLDARPSENLKDSDIDIAVIFKDYDDAMDMQFQLMRLTRNIDSRIEPHPFTVRNFNATNPLANEIIKYGERVA